jgi:hypothetical protein
VPEIRAEIVRLGMLPFENRSGEERQNFVKSETRRWANLVQRAG